MDYLFRITCICHNRCICKIPRHLCAIGGDELDDDWANTILGTIYMGMDVVRHERLDGVPICWEWRNSKHILLKIIFLITNRHRTDLVTVLTLKRLLFLVDNFVTLKTLFECEWLATNPTWEGTILLMPFDVLLQIFGIQIFSVTVGAHMLRLFDMDFLVTWQQCWSAKRLWAYDTFKWFFTRMDESMLAEIVFAEK